MEVMEINKILSVFDKPIEHPIFKKENAQALIFSKPLQSILEKNKIAEKSLTKDEEKNLFLQMNYAKHKIKDIKTNGTLTDEDKKEIFKMYKIITDIESVLISRNMPLIVNFVSSFKKSGARFDFSEAVSEGQFHLLNAIRLFDISKNYKFSTYAFYSIKNGLIQLLKSENSYLNNQPVSYEETKELVNNSCNIYDQSDEFLEELKGILEDNRAKLTKEEMHVIRARYFYQGKKPNYTKVGQSIGISRTWAKHHEDKALKKLRRFFEKFSCILQ